jgi:hypothetical protein
MKYESDIYESDIAEMIHENAMIDFKLGFISEARMREFDELCLTPEAFKEKYAQSSDAHETENIEHTDFVTAHYYLLTAPYFLAFLLRGCHFPTVSDTSARSTVPDPYSCTGV